MKTIREKAERFAVWRMGNMHNWECTYEEVAKATEIPVAQVKRICVANRWRFVEDDSEIEDVDSMMLPKIGVDVSDIHV